MIGVLSLLVTLALSTIVTRVAAMALMFTGLSREAAKFQARSAFTGSGFTTQESEMVVTHPVRRQIVMVLMLLGNVGVATVAATVMVSIMSTSNSTWQTQLLLFVVLIGGVAFLWVFFTSRWVERHMNRGIAWLLKRLTDLDVRDYVSLLELSRGYAVTEILVESRDWMAEKTLASLRLSDEGILILSIRRDGGIYHGTPRGEDVIHAGDVLIVYGNLDDVDKLDKRRAGFRGDKEHEISVEQQEEYEIEQRELIQALEAKQALETEITETVERLEN